MEKIKGHFSKIYKETPPQVICTLEDFLSCHRSNESNYEVTSGSNIVFANISLQRINGKTIEYGIGGREAFHAIAGQDIDKFYSSCLYKNGIYALTETQLSAYELWKHDVVWTPAEKLGLNEEINFGSDYINATFYMDCQDYWAKRLNSHQKKLAEKLVGSMNKEKNKFGVTSSVFGENLKTVQILGPGYLAMYFMPIPCAKIYLKEHQMTARPVIIHFFDKHNCSVSTGSKVSSNDVQEYTLIKKKNRISQDINPV